MHLLSIRFRTLEITIRHIFIRQALGSVYGSL